MRTLDVEELEAMAIALEPNDSVCWHCGAPTTENGRVLEGRHTPAVYRLARRRLVRFSPCSRPGTLHFDATPLGRTVYRIATGMEVT